MKSRSYIPGDKPIKDLQLVLLLVTTELSGVDFRGISSQLKWTCLIPPLFFCKGFNLSQSRTKSIII